MTARQQVLIVTLCGSFGISTFAVYAQIACAQGSGVLKSAVQEEQRLQPSLTVTPDTPPRPSPTRSVQQYAAGGTYRPGQSAPIPQAPAKPKPKLPPVGPLVGGPPPVALPAPPKPPPKWDYTATPRDGVMTWTPGHAVKVMPLPKPIVPPKPATQAAIFPRQTGWGFGFSPSLFGTRQQHYLTPPAVQPLVAAPLLSPKAQQALANSRSSTWEEWYKKVSGTIYEQWQRANVGPGLAKVHVTVWRSHDVDCQVADFAPAPDAARNATNETAFREAAINAVYSLKKCEILDFPYRSGKQKISFDMDFKRGVGQIPGCQIGALRETEQLPSVHKVR